MARDETEPVQTAPVTAAGGNGQPPQPIAEEDLGPTETEYMATGSGGDSLERFIPVSRFDLIAQMTRPGIWPPAEANQAIRFFHYLNAWRHIVFNERLLKIEECYQPFSPDNDVIRIHELTAEERQRRLDTLVDQMGQLLEHANFEKLDMHQLDEVLKHKSEYGLDLHVNLKDFELLQIYWRGARMIRKKRRSIKKLGLGTIEMQYPVYQRLFILLKLKPVETRVREVMIEEGCNEKKASRIVRSQRSMIPSEVTPDKVYIKLFKDIPRGDIEMVFPNTRVRFRALDKLMFGATAGGGTVAGVVTTATKVMAATNPLTIGFAVVGLGGIMARQVTSFFNQRNRYMMVLAQNLYFHSLADNRGVLTLLASRAEEEDIKEEVLLYTVLAKEQVKESELGEVKSAVEAFLRSTFGIKVSFDAADALRRLIADNIVERRPDGRLEALRPARGIEHLDRLWDGYLNPLGRDRALIEEPQTS